MAKRKVRAKRKKLAVKRTVQEAKKSAAVKMKPVRVIVPIGTVALNDADVPTKLTVDQLKLLRQAPAELVVVDGSAKPLVKTPLPPSVWQQILDWFQKL